MHVWSDLPSRLATAVQSAKADARNDPQLKAFTSSGAIVESITFGIQATGSDNIIIATVTDGSTDIRIGDAEEALFILSAAPEHWQQFFTMTPKAPYQSYWGMYGMNIKTEGVEVLGDQNAFAQWSHIWRRVLELLHDAECGPTPIDRQQGKDEDGEDEEDAIVGRYVHLKDIPLWGRCKVFYETSGDGPIPLVFLHTAGADGRQYHGILNQSAMQEKCTMYALDLPAHGRSFPYQNYWPGKHTNTEDSYVGCVAAFVKKLGLDRPIICGASMAGQVCLAIAVRADEVGAGGTIPLQACDYLDMDRQWHDKSPYVNQSLFNPEWIYGMMSPTAPLVNRQLVWHLYSNQAYGIFHGDLDFYFGGWDGRSRMSSIDTNKCPVFMLTGEYDWSNTPTMSEATCNKIAGGKHTTMKGLGHFPATENPELFVKYLLEAIDHIQETRTEPGGQEDEEEDRTHVEEGPA